MVPIIVKEGIEGLRGETCCDDDECHWNISFRYVLRLTSARPKNIQRTYSDLEAEFVGGYDLW